MCFVNGYTGVNKLGAPSIRAVADPAVGLQDTYNLLKGKPRDSSNLFDRALSPKIPDPPQLLAPPQAAKQPDIGPLKRRNNGSGFAVAAGSTLLSGYGGISSSQLSLGGQSLLGGG